MALPDGNLNLQAEFRKLNARVEAIEAELSAAKAALEPKPDAVEVQNGSQVGSQPSGN